MSQNPANKVSTHEQHHGQKHSWNDVYEKEKGGGNEKEKKNKERFTSDTVTFKPPFLSHTQNTNRSAIKTKTWTTSLKKKKKVKPTWIMYSVFKYI